MAIVVARTRLIYTGWGLRSPCDGEKFQGLQDLVQRCDYCMRYGVMRLDLEKWCNDVSTKNREIPSPRIGPHLMHIIGFTTYTRPREMGLKGSIILGRLFK